MVLIKLIISAAEKISYICPHPVLGSVGVKDTMTERLSVMSACPSAFQGDHEGTIFFFVLFSLSHRKN